MATGNNLKYTVNRESHEVETMDYQELEEAIRADAAKTAKEDRKWTAVDVSRRLEQIADEMAKIRLEHQGGIDASMGKRSGIKVEI
ncbi:MAG: hypothetical protein Q7K29_02240 [Thermoleophilia bacterium]|nr:hypothetical protein [Thermoleophilia bacterium]